MCLYSWHLEQPEKNPAVNNCLTTIFIWQQYSSMWQFYNNVIVVIVLWLTTLCHYITHLLWIFSTNAFTLLFYVIFHTLKMQYNICNLSPPRKNKQQDFHQGCTLSEKLDTPPSRLTDPECITLLHGSTVWNTHNNINLLVWGHRNKSHVLTPSTSPLTCCYFPLQHTSPYFLPAV